MKKLVRTVSPVAGAVNGVQIVPVVGSAVLGAIAAAMVGSIFSSDSWNNVTFIAGEVRNPKRNIGMSLFLGTLIVTIIYVTTNIMYTSVLSMHDIAFAEKDRVAVVASDVIFGSAGTIIIAVMLMISTFGCNNGLILAGARVYYTIQRKGWIVFFVKPVRLIKMPFRNLHYGCNASLHRHGA